MIYYQDELVTIYHADCHEILPFLTDISAVVTDPPYNLTSVVKRYGKEGSAPAKYGKDGSFQRLSKGFMGKVWDGTGVSFQPDTWRLISGVCLPGAPLLSFGGTRTFHRIACAIEDAGWQIRDTICWVYASGFPKSLDISKAIDKQAGLHKPELVPTKEGNTKHNRGITYATDTHAGFRDISEPKSPEAKLWEGYGTALKPSYEPVLVCMKPLDGTFADNALKHKVAGLNIDGCRIPFGDSKEERHTKGQYERQAKSGARYFNQEGNAVTFKYDAPQPQGRFPANFIHDGSQEVMELFPDSKSGARRKGDHKGYNSSSYMFGGRYSYDALAESGSAARFFYCAKASRRERDAGLENMPVRIAGGMAARADGSLDGKISYGKNNHPTIKPLALMTYLCKLVKMPEYNLILDPFCGSGTTLLACKKLGIPCIGIDSNEEYCEIASKRVLKG